MLEGAKNRELECCVIPKFAKAAAARAIQPWKFRAIALKSSRFHRQAGQPADPSSIGVNSATPAEIGVVVSL
jgi:hypothetical protein